MHLLGESLACDFKGFKSHFPMFSVPLCLCVTLQLRHLGSKAEPQRCGGNPAIAVYSSGIFEAGNGYAPRPAQRYATCRAKPEAFKAKKNVQDLIFPNSYAKDGKSVERRFAEDMDAAAEVRVYAKLPNGFAIPTPVGSYSPTSSTSSGRRLPSRRDFARAGPIPARIRSNSRSRTSEIGQIRKVFPCCPARIPVESDPSRQRTGEIACLSSVRRWPNCPNR